MRIETDTNLLYDDSLPDCLCVISCTQDQEFAFIQCLDIRPPNLRRFKPIPKRYWGKWSYNDPEQSIKKIMANGSQWPLLPN